MPYRVRTGSHKGQAACQRLTTCIKLLISTALVVALFYYDVITVAALRVIFRDVPIAASTFAVVLIGYVLSALRWYILLHALGIRISPRPCAEIFAMGTFANTFLPGGTGGDLLRAVYIARHVHTDRAGGVISVLADRGMGFLGVLTVGVLLGCLAPERLITSPLTRGIFLSLVGMLAALVVGMSIAVMVVNPAVIEKIRALLGTRTILQRCAMRVLEIIPQLRSNPAAFLISFVLSVLIALTIVLAVILLAQAYRSGGLGALDFANASIVALLTNAIPITPGGIGVGEAAFAFLCYSWESTPTNLAYGTIFFGQRLVTTLIGLLGSGAFVTYQRRMHREFDRADEHVASVTLP